MWIQQHPIHVDMNVVSAYYAHVEEITTSTTSYGQRKRRLWPIVTCSHFAVHTNERTNSHFEDKRYVLTIVLYVFAAKQWWIKYKNAGIRFAMTGWLGHRVRSYVFCCVTIPALIASNHEQRQPTILCIKYVDFDLSSLPDLYFIRSPCSSCSSSYSASFTSSSSL